MRLVEYIKDKILIWDFLTPYWGISFPPAIVRVLLKSFNSIWKTCFSCHGGGTPTWKCRVCSWSRLGVLSTAFGITWRDQNELLLFYAVQVSFRVAKQRSNYHFGIIWDSTKTQATPRLVNSNRVFTWDSPALLQSGLRFRYHNIGYFHIKKWPPWID